MIKFDYKKLGAADEFELSEFKQKSDQKTLLNVADKLNNVSLNSKYSDAELWFFNIDRKTLPDWRIYDTYIDNGDYDWYFLFDAKSNNLVTLDDLKQAVSGKDTSGDTLTTQFKFFCKAKKWTVKKYVDEKRKNRERNGEFSPKKLGFDPIALHSMMYRAAIKKTQKVDDKQLYSVADACKKMIDMIAAEKNVLDMYHMLVDLLERLEIPTKKS